MRRIPSFARALLAASLLVCAVSCRSVTPPGAVFASDPPGAEVVVDGRRSGYVTPCLIALDRDERYRVQFVLEGYVPFEILLEPDTTTHRVGWDDGAIAPSGLRFPLGLEAKDLFQPVRRDHSHSPNRVFVRLEPATLD